uniref:ABC transporter permease n=1 Tax=Fervidicoccus fontis TaxID=683846 RepID=A0A7J3ZNI7_9CREN
MSRLGAGVPREKRTPSILGVAFRTWSAKTSLAIILAMVTLAVGADWIAPHDPMKAAFTPFLPPCREHPFGTDDLGRDVLSRTIHGSRVSLLVGVMSAIMAIVIGTIIGLASGYFGGPLDHVLMRVTDTFQVIPRIVLATVFVAFFGPSIWNIIFVIGILSWPRTARTVRSLTLSLKESLFVEAARAMGAGDLAIIARHILPNVAPVISVLIGYETAIAILLEAGLGFLGLSDPTMVSWGKVIYDGQRYFLRGWWIPIFPGLFLSALIVSLNALTDSISTALNPKLRLR